METVNNILCMLVGILLIAVGSFMTYVYGTGPYNPFVLEIGVCLICGIMAVMFKGKALWDARSKKHSNEANS